MDAPRIVLCRDDSSPEGGDLPIDYRGELNEQQAAAGGPVLIAAGTGKTRTLVYVWRPCGNGRAAGADRAADVHVASEPMEALRSG